MARLVGVDLPREKRLEVALTYIYGIGKTRAAETLEGTGISPEDLDRIFEPYYSTKKSGTGLGLTIVNAIIADHNGYIRVRDNQPKGTTFQIELPIRI